MCGVSSVRTPLRRSCTRVAFEDRELHARILSIGPHRSDRDLLHMMDEVGVRTKLTPHMIERRPAA